MKVILWMAMSVNGIIARDNGEEDFLSHQNWIEFAKKTNEVGSLIWGRKTYEAVRKWDKKYLDSLLKVKMVILSHNPTLKLDDGFILATSPLEAIGILEKSGFNEVILTGGSTNNSSFARLNLIDEIILNIDPTIIGKGIPLFSPDLFEMKLTVRDIRQINEGLIQLRYLVD